MHRCYRVHRHKGEIARRVLLEANALERALAVGSDDHYVYLPVTDGADAVASDLPDGVFTDRDLEPVDRPVGDYRHLLDLPGGLQDLLPSSLDIIGQLAILRLPDKLLGHGTDIARAILAVHPSLRSVANDTGVKGEFRLRTLKHLAGDPLGDVVHREHGVNYLLDPRKAYFSPRLATERRRVADQVRSGEIVWDLFAGVGPFSILMAKRAPAAQIHAVELNLQAYEYLLHNIKRNGTGNVSATCADAAEAVTNLPAPDRVIMNLPRDSWRFLPGVIERMDRGGTVHIYSIQPTDQREERKTHIINTASDMGKTAEVVLIRQVKSTSPAMEFVGYDIEVK